MKKVDKARYDSDPVYRERVDAQREKQRIYQREWARKKCADMKANPKPKVEEPVSEFREVVCLGCAPDRACILNIPTSAFPGETAILHCPCDGEVVKGVAR